MIRISPTHLAIALAVCLTVPASAQEGPLSLELSFSNPGARSMGFGGAFVALADDATAAFANPAGLVQLVEPEVSVEGRGWSYSTPYVESGRLVGEPTGIGLDAAPLTTARSTESLSGLSLVSLVHPKGDWSLGFYRHRLASFAYHADVLGLYSGPWPEVNVNLRREAVMRQTTDLEITSFAVAGAYRVNETLSLGLGVNVHHGQLSMITESYGHACGGFGYPPCAPDPLGVSFRTADQRLTLGLEWDRVDYSDMIDDDAGLRLEDGDELRLGAEYVFVERSPVLSLRLGLWLDPDHRMRYEGRNYVAERLLTGGGDELHFAAGLGLAFGRMTLDFGLDLSDLVDTLSVSTIFRL